MTEAIVVTAWGMLLLLGFTYRYIDRDLAIALALAAGWAAVMVLWFREIIRRLE